MKIVLWSPVEAGQERLEVRLQALLGERLEVVREVRWAGARRPGLLLVAGPEPALLVAALRRQLRAPGTQEAVPILALGPASAAAAERALDEGAWDYLPLPLDPMLLEIRLQSLMRQSRSQDQARHQAEHALAGQIERRRQSEQRAQSYLKQLAAHAANSPLVIIELDGDGRFLQWTGAAERLFGWREDEVLGRHVLELPWLAQEDRPQVAAVLQRLLGGAAPSGAVEAAASPRTATPCAASGTARPWPMRTARCTPCWRWGWTSPPSGGPRRPWSGRGTS